MYDVESEARRASDARYLEFERRWVKSIAKALDKVTESADGARGVPATIRAALRKLEDTQVEAEDPEIVAFIKKTRATLDRYESFERAMELLAEEAYSLSESFK